MTEPSAAKAELGLSLAFLQERARLLEATVLKQQLATPEQIDTVRPGGHANPDTGPAGVHYFIVELRALQVEGQLARAPSRTEPTDVEQLAALTDRPVRVQLPAEVDDVPPRFVYVYPKSLVALQYLASLDYEVGVLAAGLQILESSTGPDDLVLALGTRVAITYRYQLLAWIVTTAGPGLPFPEEAQDPRPPDTIVDGWSPIDVLLIARGHVEANQARLTALSGLLAIDTGHQRNRASWAAIVASEASSEVPPSVVVRDRSLVSMVARRVREARTQADARKRSEARP